MQECSAPRAVPNSSGIEPPRLKAPANAADCHIHIYDARFQSSDAALSNAAVQDYRLLQKRIGVTRVVIVTPRNYVTDNSVTDDALLFDLLTAWAPQEATRNRILVANPQTLYGFLQSA